MTASVHFAPPAPTKLALTHPRLGMGPSQPKGTVLAFIHATEIHSAPPPASPVLGTERTVVNKAGKMLLELHSHGGGRQYADTLVNCTTRYMMAKWKVKQRREVSVGVVRFSDRMVKGGVTEKRTLE